MGPALGILLVLVLASGAASNWQLPSGWKPTQPQPNSKKGPTIGPKK